MIPLRYLLICCFATLWLTVDGIAQDLTPDVAAAGAGCARNTEVLNAALDRHRSSPTFILVARLGDGERDSKWAHRRLHNVKTYLAEWGVSTSQIVTATGERIGGSSRVEVYASGQLVAVLEAARNRDVPVSLGCEGEVFSYYPHLDHWQEQHRRRQQKPRRNKSRT